MKRILSICFSLSLTAGFSQIQSQDFYSFRMNNMFNVNPAYAASEDGLSIYAGGVSQAKGVDFNTKNLTFGVYSKLSKSQALGGNVITDSRGAFQTTKASLSYAYLVRLSTNSTLSFGLSGGILSNSLNQNRISNYNLLDQTDPTLANTYYNSVQFIAGAGALFSYKNLEISASLPHIVASNQDLNVYSHAMTGYKIKAGDQFTVTPSIYIQGIPSLRNVFGGQARVAYKETIWIQLGYQSNNMFLSAIGFNYENFSIGYGYRMNNKAFASIASGVHEVVLSYKFQTRSKKAPTYNPTLIEIDHRLTRLLTRKITAENKAEFVEEIRSIKKLMINTEINNSTPESSNEAADYLKSIESKLVQLQNKINAI